MVTSIESGVRVILEVGGDARPESHLRGDRKVPVTGRGEVPAPQKSANPEPDVSTDTTPGDGRTKVRVQQDVMMEVASDDRYRVQAVIRPEAASDSVRVPSNGQRSETEQTQDAERARQQDGRAAAPLSRSGHVRTITGLWILTLETESFSGNENATIPVPISLVHLSDDAHQEHRGLSEVVTEYHAGLAYQDVSFGGHQSIPRFGQPTAVLQRTVPGSYQTSRHGCQAGVRNRFAGVTPVEAD